MLLDVRDPLDEKEQQRVSRKVASTKSKTFMECAEAYIDAHKAGWKNAKHAAQWTSTLETYAEPVFKGITISSIDTTLVMKVFEPIWKTKTETATRVRGRIESVLDWATVSGYRSGENPARWKGHLDHLLPKRSKVQKVEYHPALPYSEAPEFMKVLRSQAGIAALALEFLILTATRTNETIGARWDEIDIKNRVWTIPGSRMKTGKEHRVPLSAQAIKILKRMQSDSTGECVFPGQRDGNPMSNMVFLQLLKRMGRSDITAHGFRSTFRDWVGETTQYPREVAEAALAHILRNKAETAYARGDLFMRRTTMMHDWAKYLGD